MRFDCIIIGAGVLGLSLAFHLGSSRKAKVLVLDKEILPGMHASGKNAGMFRQLYRNPMLTQWAFDSRMHWPRALRESCFKETGSLVIGRQKPHHLSDLFKQTEFTKVINGKQCSVDAVLTKTDGLIDSPNYVQALYSSCKQMGVEIRLCSKIQGIIRSSQYWSIETDSGDRYSAAYLVNSSGAWLDNTLQRFNPNLVSYSQAYARHLFLIKGFPRNYMPGNIEPVGFYWDEIDSWYMRAWETESRLVSICDACSADPDYFVPNENINSVLASKLISAFPEIADNLAVVRSWHCFRTYSADQLPVIGPDPEEPSLYWLGAFGGFGMSTSFGATKCLADQMMGVKHELPTEFSVGRFRTFEPKLTANFCAR